MKESKWTTALITYKNHRGDVRKRQVLPLRMWHGETQWHPRSQWFLNAFDVDKMAVRDFAFADILEWHLLDEEIEENDGGQ